MLVVGIHSQDIGCGVSFLGNYAKFGRFFAENWPGLKKMFMFFWNGGVSSCKNFDPSKKINKVLQKLKLSKTVNNKSCLPNLISLK